MISQEEIDLLLNITKEHSMDITKVGIEHIITQIKERSIYPPEGLTVEQLQAWLSGYSQCQGDVLDVIESIKEGASRC